MKFVIYSVIAVLAIVSAVIAFRISDQPVEQSTVSQVNKAPEINVSTVDVLVARTNIPVGTIIDNGMIDRQPWPENLVLEGFIIKDSGGDDNIVGKVARSPIQAQEPFMKSKLANPNDPGFLAANLPTGMRAITVSTDAVSGVAGFVFPGDKVDLLFTHDGISSASAKTSSGPQITEVIGTNIKVLAINLRDTGDLSRPSSISPNSVTLEVTETMAQQLRLAEKNGTISLSLRSIRDDSNVPPKPTSVEDISSASASKQMTVVRGPGAKGGKIEYEFLNGSLNQSTNEHSEQNGELPPANKVNVINNNITK